MTAYNFHADPGHGWLEVDLDELIDLGIADKITPYSYRMGDTVYLEEDCDLTTFCRAKQEAGQKVEFIEHHTNSDSFVRSLSAYHYPGVHANG